MLLVFAAVVGLFMLVAVGFIVYCDVSLRKMEKSQKATDKKKK